MKEKIKAFMKKAVGFIFNPRLLLCVGIAWMITNGWSYVFVGVGTVFKNKWLVGIGMTYLSFLWFPFTPEKIVTCAIAIWLLKVLFPNDKKTLAIVQSALDNTKAAFKKSLQKRKEKRAEKKRLKKEKKEEAQSQKSNSIPDPARGKE